MSHTRWFSVIWGDAVHPSLTKTMSTAVGVLLSAAPGPTGPRRMFCLFTYEINALEYMDLSVSGPDTRSRVTADLFLGYEGNIHTGGAVQPSFAAFSLFLFCYSGSFIPIITPGPIGPRKMYIGA